MSVDPRAVAVYQVEGRYHSEPPYSPSEGFPEYPWGPVSESTPNHGYRAVRGALQLLGLDETHFGTATWNPLGEIVHPGDTVVLKPNFIRDFHDTNQEHMVSVITHGSVIRAVLDYVAIALRGQGRVVIADAPQSEADFDRIIELTGLREIQEFYRRHATIRLDVIDLRPECADKVDGVIVGHRSLPGDPAGYTKVNLGAHSEFMAINHLSNRLYGSEYDRSEVAAHHHDNVHEYLISKTILDADVFINLPKMKTHKKVGVTLNLKNLVGINGNKNWLPHHREGVPADGGDQFAASGFSERVEHLLSSVFKRHFPKFGRLRQFIGGPAKRIGRAAFGDTGTNRIRSGNWYGNDTTWRMVLDLNRAFYYADGLGTLHDTPQRRYFSFVDGIVAGEGNGPMGCDPRMAGLVFAGVEPLAVDIVCARLMGFDYERIPTLRQAFGPHAYPIASFTINDLKILSNREEYTGRMMDLRGSALAIKSHFGWRGHIELDAALCKSLAGKVYR